MIKDIKQALHPYDHILQSIARGRCTVVSTSKRLVDDFVGFWRRKYDETRWKVKAFVERRREWYTEERERMRKVGRIVNVWEPLPYDELRTTKAEVRLQRPECPQG